MSCSTVQPFCLVVKEIEPCRVKEKNLVDAANHLIKDTVHFQGLGRGRGDIEQRCKLSRLFFHFGIKPGIVNRDGCMGRQGRNRAYFFGAKFIRHAAVDGNDARPVVP